SLLQPGFVTLQEATIARCCWQKHRETFITALLEHDPALLRADPPPPSQAIVHALSYGNAHLIPVLTRIWPLPDDLPHAAGTGDAAAGARWDRWRASIRAAIRSSKPTTWGGAP